MKTRPRRSAGLRVSFWNADRETWVSAYDGEAEGLDVDGGRWQVVCERHGNIVSVETLAVARDDAKYGDPIDFCEECQTDPEGVR